MVKAPVMGQRSILADNIEVRLEVISKSGNSQPLARREQVWLVRDGLYKRRGSLGSLSTKLRRTPQELASVNSDPTLERIARGNGLALCAGGSWTARFAPVLEQIVTDAEKLTGSRPNIFIDVSQVSKLDTFGAWLIERLRRALTVGGQEAQIAGLSANYPPLVDEARKVQPQKPQAAGRGGVVAVLDGIGR